MDYNTFIALNYQIEEEFFKCIAESKLELTQDDFLKILANFSVHLVDSMQKCAPKEVNVKQIFHKHFKTALDFWKEQLRGEYLDLMPNNMGEA